MFFSNSHFNYQARYQFKVPSNKITEQLQNCFESVNPRAHNRAWNTLSSIHECRHPHLLCNMLLCYDLIFIPSPDFRLLQMAFLKCAVLSSIVVGSVYQFFFLWGAISNKRQNGKATNSSNQQFYFQEFAHRTLHICNMTYVEKHLL